MKISKICVFLFLIFLAAPLAQTKSLSYKYPSLYDTEWEKKIKLTNYQLEQVNLIRKANQEKMNVYLMEIETLHHEMAALVEENDEQIRAILSEKQKIKFDMYHYQLKKKNNEHKGEEKPSRKKMRIY